MFELLRILTENREKHRGIFLEAQEGFRQRVIEELDRRLADVRQHRHIDLYFQLPEPEDHTSDYDREIRMLEMELSDKVVLTSTQFEQLVLDRWPWRTGFETSTASYLKR